MSNGTSPLKPESSDWEQLDRIIAENQGRPGFLLRVLEALQDRTPHKYLPQDALEYIAERTGIPLSQICSVVTFYALFNLEPQGKNTVCICRGTACHTRGSRNLLERLKLELGLKTDDDEVGADKVVLTTGDQKYTLRTVACFGQCALAPVVELNHRVYGHMNEQALQRELEAIEDESR